MSVVTAHDSITLDALADMVKIDGNPVPAILKFEASIEPQDEGDYFVSYEFNTSRPVVTATSSSQGGVVRSSFQYQNVGVESSVRIGLNQAITILKDPDKEVSLELQSVDE